MLFVPIISDHLFYTLKKCIMFMFFRASVFNAWTTSVSIDNALKHVLFLRIM